MPKKSICAILIWLTVTSSPKCLAIVGENLTPIRAPIELCFERYQIENYKSTCEADRADLDATEIALQKSLSAPPDLEFYQERPFFISHVMLTFLLGVVAFKATR